MSGETFGQMLRRYREARKVTVTRHNASWLNDRVETVVMSQNELARRAGIDTAYVHSLEAGRTAPRSDRPYIPTRRTVEALAIGLDLDEADTARLLIGAGYWPWQDMEEGEIDQFVTAVLIDVVGPDWRRTG